MPSFIYEENNINGIYCIVIKLFEKDDGKEIHNSNIITFEIKTKKLSISVLRKNKWPSVNCWANIDRLFNFEWYLYYNIAFTVG